jgi:hypothetical protein
VQYARKNNYLRRVRDLINGKAGIPDLVNSARMVIQDWQQNKIPYFTMPDANAKSEKLTRKILDIIESLPSKAEMGKIYKVKALGIVATKMDLKALPKGYTFGEHEESDVEEGWEEEMMDEEMEQNAEEMQDEEWEDVEGEEVE